MRTFDLPVTVEEVAFLANNLPAGARWPEPYDSFSLAQIPDGQPGGGPVFRLKIITLSRFMRSTWTDATPAQATLPLELTEAELWMLDYVLNTVDYSKVRMANNTPLFKLVNKVWGCLLDANILKVDPRYIAVAQPAKIELLPGVREQQQAFLAEVDELVSGAERTASGEQFLD